MLSKLFVSMRARRSFIISSFLFLSVFVGAAEAFAVTPTITGNLPRDLATGTFDVTIIAKDVPNTETALIGTEKTLQDKIRLYVKGDSVNFATSPDNPPVGTKFYWILRNEVDVTADANGTTSTMTWAGRVIQFDTNLATAVVGGKITLTVDYMKDGTKQVSGEGTLERKIVVANQAPSGLIAIGSEQALTISWNKDASIAYKGENNAAAASAAPGDGVIILMRRSANITSLPAKTFSGSATADTDGVTCSVDLDAGTGNTCVTCPDTSTYLDVTEIESSVSTDLKIKTTDKTSVSFTGLENETDYVAVAMYHPDGVQRSACLVGQPTEDLTLSELNGEKKATPTKFHCFIATAAYGSTLHHNLNRFRWLRDEVLRKSSVGTNFVNWYYKNSPPIARYIAKHPTAAALTRGVLWVPVAGVIGAQTWLDRPALAGVTIATLFIAAFVLVISRRNRRRLKA